MTREEALRTAAEVLQQTVSRDPYTAPSPVPTDDLLRVAEWLLAEDALDVAPTVALAKPRRYRDGDGDHWVETAPGSGRFDLYWGGVTRTTAAMRSKPMAEIRATYGDEFVSGMEEVAG